MNRKAIIGTVVGIVVAILLIFATGFSEGLEKTVMYILGGLSLLSLIIATMDDDKKSLLTLVGVIGFGITFGLIAWSEHNSSIRRDKEYEIMHEKNKIKFAEQAKQDSIKHIKDSIQNYKDSLAMVEDSKRLYAQEGDSIFGDFNFGMSEKQCEAIIAKIQKETNGCITIADHDFRIDGCRFHNHKLYLIRLKSANTWVRYYFHDAHDYDDSEGLGTGNDIVERIKDRLSKKYGKPNNSDNWHFTYKDINVRSGVSSSSREGLLSTEYWAIFLTIYNPQMADEAERAEKDQNLKYQNEKRAAEEELKRKKESFSDGL